MEIPPPPEPAPEAIPPAVPPNKEERLWAMTAHLSAFVGYFFPFGNILGPLVVWIAKRDTSEFVEDQARESLNAQISVTIYLAVAAVLFLIIIGIPIFFGLLLANVVLIIVASIKASDGLRYRYPLIFRLVK